MSAIQRKTFPRPSATLLLATLLLGTMAPVTLATEAPRVDLLSFAQGAIPVGIEGDAASLGVGMDQALQIIDGDTGGFSLTPKPGGADTRIDFIYELPAATSFESFAVPSILETPSPSQTFARRITIAGSSAGSAGPFEDLAAATLATHTRKDETTPVPANTRKSVRWIRVTLEGGILIERDKMFLEFSELLGYGTQAAPPRSDAFTGKWKGRGVTLELAQDGAVVNGCYDGEGDLTGTVSGNLLHATGKSRKGDIPSAFVLAVGADKGIFGVRSTNGGRFRLYAADASPSATTECSGKPVAPLGCGSIIHGIQFDFDSAAIRPDSGAVLDALHAGLRDSPATSITVIGHTSSEGAEAYNEDLSKRRARAVVAALAARNVDSSRLAAQGRGEKQPMADNATEAGRVLNRRVEISCR